MLNNYYNSNSTLESHEPYHYEFINKERYLFKNGKTINDIKKEMTENTKKERVYHPSHYTWLKKLCGIEVIDITRHLSFDRGNAIKYLLRAGNKHEQGYTDKQKTIEDLKKAKFYIDDEIRQLENDKEKI